MSLDNETSRNFYTGDGATSQFSFTFKITSASELVVYKRDSDGNESQLVLDTDYTASGLNDDDGGTITLTAGALTSGHKIAIFRKKAITQLTDLVNQGSFYPEVHESALDKLTMIAQQIQAELDRAIKIPHTFNPTAVTTSVPDLVAKAILRINEDASGFELAEEGEFIGPQGEQGNPPFVGAGDPNDDTTGYLDDAISGDIYIDGDGYFWSYNGSTWTKTDVQLQVGSATAEGYSARYGETVSLTTLQEIVNYIFKFEYTAPGITLTSAGSTTIREKGVGTSAGTLTAVYTKKTNPIANVEFFVGATSINTVSAPSASGGTATYDYANSFSDTTTFYAKVTDESSSSGGPSTSTASVTYTFVYPYYFGAGSSGLSAAAIAALTKSVIISTATLAKTFTAAAGQVLYFAYPASYGALSSILDANNFETIGDWTRTTKSITGTDGTSQSYYCYEFNNALVAGNYTYTFKR